MHYYKHSLKNAKSVDDIQPKDNAIRDDQGNLLAFATKRAVADSSCNTVSNEEREINIKKFKRFKHSGSTFGLPEELSPTKVLRSRLSELDYDSGRIHVQKIVDKLIQLAETGSIAAIEAIMNRVDGKVVEKHEIENKNPVTLVFKPAFTSQTQVESTGPHLELTGGCPNPAQQLIIEGSAKDLDGPVD